MRFMAVCLASAITLGLLCNLHLAAEKDEAPKSDMEKKLRYSTNILAGLVEEDFDKILKNSSLLNKLGERKWLENESPRYRAQNQVFWTTADSLTRAAEEKNIDGATLAYTQMTVSCVNCHKVIRKK